MAATELEKAFCLLELAKTNSVTVVQRHFRRRYGKPPLTRQSMTGARNFKKLVVYAKVKVLGDNHEKSLEAFVRHSLASRGLINICRVKKGSHVEHL